MFRNAASLRVSGELQVANYTVGDFVPSPFGPEEFRVAEIRGAGAGEDVMRCGGRQARGGEAVQGSGRGRKVAEGPWVP